MSDFQGDLLLIDTPDGGDITVDNGFFKADRAFATAVYLSLFGGNKEDAGKIKTNKTWWGNTLEGITEAEKMASRFQNIISGLPLTVKNIKAAETAAKLDLAWVIDQGIADKIEAEGRTGEKNYFVLEVQILKNENTVFENSYALLWGEGLNGGV
jgi:phage gp46-like protein